MYKIFVGKPLGKIPEDIDVDWIILLKRTSDKLGWRAWITFVWLRIETLVNTAMDLGFIKGRSN
jgi:hypothetical protein